MVRLLLVYFSFTLLWYTTSEMPAVMTSVTQKAFQMPSSSTFVVTKSAAGPAFVRTPELNRRNSITPSPQRRWT